MIIVAMKFFESVNVSEPTHVAHDDEETKLVTNIHYLINMLINNYHTVGGAAHSEAVVE